MRRLIWNREDSPNKKAVEMQKLRQALSGFQQLLIYSIILGL